MFYRLDILVRTLKWHVCFNVMTKVLFNGDMSRRIYNATQKSTLMYGTIECRFESLLEVTCHCTMHVSRYTIQHELGLIDTGFFYII